jgi:hypothetical protein
MPHVAVAEKFELRRSSRAQVSQAIAAIHYNRFVFIECALGFIQQMREREVNRAANRGGAELVSGQHVDDLPTFGDYLLNFTMINDPHQFQFYAASRCPASRRAAIREGPPLEGDALFPGDFLQDVDLRTPIEKGADRATEGLHVIGFAMMIERGLIGVNLVVDVFGGVLYALVQDVLQCVRFGGTHRLNHFARGFFELLLASGFGFEFGNDSNRHRILLATDWFRHRRGLASRVALRTSPALISP